MSTPTQLRASSASPVVSDAIRAEVPSTVRPAVAVPSARCRFERPTSSSDAPVSVSVAETTASTVFFAIEKSVEPSISPATLSSCSEPPTTRSPSAGVRSTVMPAIWSSSPNVLLPGWRSIAVVQSSGVAPPWARLAPTSIVASATT